MAEKHCTSCKTKVINDKGFATFLCPQCTKYELVRCAHCREAGIRYTCPGCNFLGPN